MTTTDSLDKKELQLIVFRLQKEEFGIDIKDVREILQMVDITHIPEAPGYIVGVINLRGQIIAVIDLAKQFDLTTQLILTNTARIIVVEVDNITLGMIVDKIPQVLKLSENDIHPAPEMIRTRINANYIKGIGKIGDRLIVLLDLIKLVTPDKVKVAAEYGKE